MKLPTRVIGCVEAGTLRIKVGVGIGMLDGGMEMNVPVEAIPPDLRMPNSQFLVSFAPDKSLIVERIK